MPLVCALMVASGLTCARTRSGTTVADCKAFLLELLQSARCPGLHVVHRMLDHGSTHAPKHLGTWIASLALSLTVKISGLPPQARGLDQVEIIFSKVQRDIHDNKTDCEIWDLAADRTRGVITAGGTKVISRKDSPRVFAP